MIENNSRIERIDGAIFNSNELFVRFMHFYNFFSSGFFFAVKMNESQQSKAKERKTKLHM